MDLEFAISAFMTLFAIINPIGNIPIFEALTEDFPSDVKKKVARNAMLYTMAVLLVFGLAGKWIFEVYGITLPAFKVMGGLLLFYLGFNMVEGRGSTHKMTEKYEDIATMESVAFIPLTIPLYGGPGTIATTMILISTGSGPFGIYAVMIIFAMVGVILSISYLLLVTSEKVFRYLGKNGTIAVTRLTGILLAAMGVSFIISGAVQAVASCGC